MVALSIIRQSNAQLKTAAAAPKVAVFVGATSGIGHATFRELVQSGSNTKIYLIGRASSASQMQARIADLTKDYPNAQIVWLEGEISLLADVRRMCDEIKSKESTLDLLFMSAGFLPFSGRKETSEGIDTSQSIQYFARMAFITNLLPLLRSASRGRVISVLGGGAAKIDEDDLELKKPGAYGAIRNQSHLTTMNTLMMDKMAEQEKSVTFIHTLPGPVSTGNLAKDASSSSPTSWMLKLVAQPLVKLVGMSPRESGERHLFISTSAVFGGKGVDQKLPEAKNTKGDAGPGLFLVNPQCEVNVPGDVMAQLRESTQGKVWEYTQKVLEPYV